MHAYYLWILNPCAVHDVCSGIPTCTLIIQLPVMFLQDQFHNKSKVFLIFWKFKVCRNYAFRQCVHCQVFLLTSVLDHRSFLIAKFNHIFPMIMYAWDLKYASSIQQSQENIQFHLDANNNFSSFMQVSKQCENTVNPKDIVIFLILSLSLLDS